MEIKVVEIPKKVWENGIWFSGYPFKVLGDGEIKFDEIRIESPSRIKSEDSIVKVSVKDGTVCRKVESNNWSVLVCDTEDKIKETIEDLISREMEKAGEVI